jgi:hypothetical protein
VQWATAVARSDAGRTDDEFVYPQRKLVPAAGGNQLAYDAPVLAVRAAAVPAVGTP